MQKVCVHFSLKFRAFCGMVFTDEELEEALHWQMPGAGTHHPALPEGVVDSVEPKADRIGGLGTVDLCCPPVQEQRYTVCRSTRRSVDSAPVYSTLLRPVCASSKCVELLCSARH